MTKETKKGITILIVMLVVLTIIGLGIYEWWKAYNISVLLPEDIGLTVDKIELCEIEVAEYAYDHVRKYERYGTEELSSEISKNILDDIDHYRYLVMTYTIANYSSSTDVTYFIAFPSFLSEQADAMAVGYVPNNGIRADQEIPANSSNWMRQRILMHTGEMTDSEVLKSVRSGVVDIRITTGESLFRRGVQEMSFAYTME